MIDLDDIGITIDDLDLDYVDDLPALPLDRPRHRPRGWWTPTELEAEHLDLPDFTSGTERTRYMVEAMARSALARHPGATADDQVLPYRGGTASLNQLLATIDHDAIDELLGVSGETK